MSVLLLLFYSWKNWGLVNLKKIFIMIDLQCSDNFCCTAKRPSHMNIYIYIYIPFLTFSSIMLHHKWYIVSHAIQQGLIACPLQMQGFSSTNPKFSAQPTPSPSLAKMSWPSPSSPQALSFILCCCYGNLPLLRESWLLTAPCGSGIIWQSRSSEHCFRDQPFWVCILTLPLGQIGQKPL